MKIGDGKKIEVQKQKKMRDLGMTIDDIILLF